MLAIISDIHSNTVALKAVYDDIAARGIDTIICLGDVLGYGPEPTKCLDMIRERTSICLMGNHDYAVIYEPSKFNIGAESACYWTRRQLESEPDADLRAQRWDFLGKLPVKQTMSGESVQAGELTFVHGSPRRPVNEYVFPDDVYNAPTKLQGCFDRFAHLCFVGHTHVPGVFLEAPDFYGPDELDNGVFEFDDAHKALINVGSVGQPRDRDPRASYVIVEPRQVRFCRVEYDADAVAEMVRNVAELDDFLGIRLREGR